MKFVRIFAESIIQNKNTMNTYDIQFDDATASNSMGFSLSLTDAQNWVKFNNGTDHSYFNDYPGGTVSIVCNETGECVESFNVINEFVPGRSYSGR